MLKKYTLILLLSFPFLLQGQTVIWAEDFNNGCTDNCGADGYTSTNGTWTVVDMAAPGDVANEWFVSCAENGEPIGSCGAGCGNNATLHVGNDPNSPSAGVFCPTGDCGAAYDAGGYCDILGTPPSVITDILATSPAIDCSGRTTITLAFNYIERGQSTNDNATVMYYDGSTWSPLADMAKTANTCGAGQGKWTSYRISLPGSAGNKPNVCIAFQWVND